MTNTLIDDTRDSFESTVKGIEHRKVDTRNEFISFFKYFSKIIFRFSLTTICNEFKYISVNSVSKKKEKFIQYEGEKKKNNLLILESCCLFKNIQFAQWIRNLYISTSDIYKNDPIIEIDRYSFKPCFPFIVFFLCKI
jgi:hypothetical protein